MVNLPIHDNVSGLNVVWNLNYITILYTIHVKMPTEHGNWLYIYIYHHYRSYEELQHLRRTDAVSHLELTYLLLAGEIS